MTGKRTVRYKSDKKTVKFMEPSRRFEEAGNDTVALRGGHQLNFESQDHWYTLEILRGAINGWLDIMEICCD